jgi:hypothetical protein
MPDYHNGKIYKITDGVGVYIGSTTVPLSQRLAEHKNSKRQYEKGNRKRKCTSYEVLNDESVITLLEDFPCERKEQLLSRERYHIENNACINKCMPIRTEEEMKQAKLQYRQANNSAICERNKVYNLKNKEKITKSRRQYRENNAVLIKEHKKEYYQRERAVILERRKQQYLENRDKINERRKELYKQKKNKT